LCWPTPCSMQVATTRRSCLTAASEVSMYGVVGQWTWFSARIESYSPRKESPASARERAVETMGTSDPRSCWQRGGTAASIGGVNIFASSNSARPVAALSDELPDQREYH